MFSINGSNPKWPVMGDGNMLNIGGGVRPPPATITVNGRCEFHSN